MPRPRLLLKLGTQTVSATVQPPPRRASTPQFVSVKTPAQRYRRGRSLYRSRCRLRTLCREHDLGGFILIDKATNATVAAGMLNFRAAPRAERPLAGRRSTARRMFGRSTRRRVPALVHRVVRLGQIGSRQHGREVPTLGKHSFLLDGDNIRHGLNR